MYRIAFSKACNEDYILEEDRLEMKHPKSCRHLTCNIYKVAFNHYLR